MAVVPILHLVRSLTPKMALATSCDIIYGFLNIYSETLCSQTTAAGVRAQSIWIPIILCNIYVIFESMGMVPLVGRWPNHGGEIYEEKVVA